MARIVNLHRRDTPNRGDVASGVHNYFPNIRPMELTGWKYENPARREKWRSICENAELVIVGGGGLLEFDKHRDSIEYVMNLKKPKKVIWGAGHNTVKLESWSSIKPSYQYDYSGFDLIGVRDVGHGMDWVPCASCMAEEFDRDYEITQEITFFVNGGIKNFQQYIPKGVSHDDVVLNLKSSLEDILKSLAKAETIVTSSYHGAYWGTLLGRKVVGLPTSSKFYDMKHAIPIGTSQDWERFVPLARSYPDALQECREATLAFKERVLSLLD